MPVRPAPANGEPIPGSSTTRLPGNVESPGEGFGESSRGGMVVRRRGDPMLASPTVGRYARLLWVQLRASAATAMAYRIDFLVDGMISLWWMIWSLVPLAVVFQGRGEVAGWTFAEALVVIAWFT